MKKLLFILSIIAMISFYSCKKEAVVPVEETSSNLTSKGSVDYTNPNPTWTQVISPLLLSAKWSAQWVPTGFGAGVVGPYDSDSKVIVSDTTVVIRWHLHVGLRNFNSQLKADVVDYRYFYINGVQTAPKFIPNGGVMGDYDFIDTVKVIRNGYYNSYFPTETNQVSERPRDITLAIFRKMIGSLRCFDSVDGK